MRRRAHTRIPAASIIYKDNGIIERYSISSSGISEELGAELVSTPLSGPLVLETPNISEIHFPYPSEIPDQPFFDQLDVLDPHLNNDPNFDTFF